MEEMDLIDDDWYSLHSIRRYVELKIDMAATQIELDSLKSEMAHPEIKKAEQEYALKYLELWGPGSKLADDEIDRALQLSESMSISPDPARVEYAETNGNDWVVNQ